MYIFISVGVLCIVLGILIKHFKFYGLISGYNTMSKEKRKNVDADGLGRFMGNLLFILGGIIILGGVLIFTGYKAIGITLVIVLPFIIIPYIMIKSQKYDKNAFGPDGRMKKGTKHTIGYFIGFMGIILVLIVSLNLYGAKEPDITVNNECIQIDGMYASKVGKEDIYEVVLLDSIPIVQRKDNGFDFGNILRGNFTLENIGKGKLYINNGKPPYVYLKLRNGYVIINYKNSDKTQELYNEIRLNITG